MTAILSTSRAKAESDREARMFVSSAESHGWPEMGHLNVSAPAQR
jgi:hypothetical protein